MTTAVVKLRIVAGSVVVTLPRDILKQAGLQIGEQVIVEASVRENQRKRLIITALRELLK
jgi:antitoxin component of MazEF toxin-antitoxin module